MIDNIEATDEFTSKLASIAKRCRTFIYQPFIAVAWRLADTQLLLHASMEVHIDTARSSAGTTPSSSAAPFRLPRRPRPTPPRPRR